MQLAGEACETAEVGPIEHTIDGSLWDITYKLIFFPLTENEPTGRAMNDEQDYSNTV